MKCVIAAVQPGTARQGRVIPLDFRPAYIEHLLNYIEPARLKPLKVVANAGNGGAENFL